MPRKIYLWFGNSNKTMTLSTPPSVKMWFNAKKINVFEWPTQSPDLNPTENLWEEVDRNINRSTGTNLDLLWIEITAAWDAITPE